MKYTPGNDTSSLPRAGGEKYSVTENWLDSTAAPRADTYVVGTSLRKYLAEGQW